MKHHWALTIVLSAFSHNVIAAGNATSDTTHTIKTVKIGSGAPKSGGIAHLGQDNELGAQLAVNDINASGLVIGRQRIHLELVGEDDAGDAKQGIEAAEQIAASDAVAVVGHLNSGVSIPANAIYSAAGMAQVSPSSTNPAYTLRHAGTTPKGNRSAYRVIPNDIQQGKMLGKWLIKHKAKNVAILDDSTQYGHNLANYVKDVLTDNRVNIALNESLTDRTTDFRSILAKIKASDVDYIFWGGMDDTGAALAKQMKRLGLKAKLLSGDGLCTQNFIEIAGNDAEGAVCAQGGEPLSTMSRGAWFAQHFHQQTGRDVEIYAPYAYDAVYAIVEAMKIAQSIEREAIAAAMPKVDFKGLTGRLRFDADGDIQNGAVTMSRVVNGRLNFVEVLR